MIDYLLLDEAEERLAEILDYTRDRWGETQAIRYFHGLAERFRQIAAREFTWSPIAPAFGVDGYVCRYERHLIYWRILSDNRIGIVTILHERMHHIDRVAGAFAEHEGQDALPPD